MVLNLPSIFTLLFVSVHGAEADVHLSACCCVSLFIVLKLATSFHHCVSLSMVLKLPTSFNHCVSMSMVPQSLSTLTHHCVSLSMVLKLPSILTCHCVSLSMVLKLLSLPLSLFIALGWLMPGSSLSSQTVAILHLYQIDFLWVALCSQCMISQCVNVHTLAGISLHPSLSN